jgi:hypothetical protein
MPDTNYAPVAVLPTALEAAVRPNRSRVSPRPAVGRAEAPVGATAAGGFIVPAGGILIAVSLGGASGLLYRRGSTREPLQGPYFYGRNAS